MVKAERDFQKALIKTIYSLFPNSMVFKTDPTYRQGSPDLIVLCGNTWAALECKKSAKASRRPNQGHYISKMNKMSYASFIYPENKEEVLNEMGRQFATQGNPRDSLR